MVELYAGFDIGSSAIHCSVIDENLNVVYSPAPKTHCGQPLAVLKEAIWPELVQAINVTKLRSTAFTGIGASLFPSVFEGALYEYDSVTLARGIHLVAPDACAAFHLGAKDSYYFNISEKNGKPSILEWATNTKCGAGSGTLVEKQIRRLFVSDSGPSGGALPDGLFQAALREASEYTQAPGYNARCGVVIQSDLIHDQNEGMHRPLILAKLFRTVASNYVQDVIGSRCFDPDSKVVMTGGLARIAPIAEWIGKLTSTQIEIPGHFLNVGAIGAAILAAERGNSLVLDPERIGEVAQRARERRQFAPSLATSLSRVHLYEKEPVTIPAGAGSAEDPEVVLGVDGGSTTTKAVLVHMETGEILDSMYISTHGNPLKALQDIIRRFSNNRERYSIVGVCTTGSARKLFERVLVSPAKRKDLEFRGFSVPDAAVDEITCHALGVKSWDSEIDTVFEIGGQDMKFTTFKRTNGRATEEVQEARMNYSCQAGAGQTLENMADIIGLDIRESLQEEALKAEKVPVIDATCGVFMEMEENRLIAENFSRSEIAAAIVRSTAASYFNKFVGGRQHVGDRCSCQGGPALGKAFLAAMAQVTGSDIHAYPYRELFGAYGAALWVRKRILDCKARSEKTKTAFRGWDVSEATFSHEEQSCRDYFGALSCGTRNCTLKIFGIGDEQIVSGGFCPRGNSEGVSNQRRDYVSVFHEILERHFDGVVYDDLGSNSPEDKPTIGIRRCGSTIDEHAVWASALFRYLGFLPVLSPVSDQRISSLGTRLASTEYCVAMKLATGHAALMATDERISHIFIPSLIDTTSPEGRKHMYCIYTEAEGFVLKDLLALDDSRLLLPVWHLGKPAQMARELRRVMKKAGYDFPMAKILEAFRHADEKARIFLSDLAAEGENFIQNLQTSDEPGYVGTGRDYVLLDPEASSNSGYMFSKTRGMRYIPQIFLRHRFEEIPIDELVDNEYWKHSKDILQASVFIARQPNLYPVRLMNFACGPDSIKFFMEQEIFRRAEKPFLHLMTDAQTNNAPFVTRAEAHQRVVERHKESKAPTLGQFSFRPMYGKVDGSKRHWLIPYMGKVSPIAASAARHWGIDARVMPTGTPQSRFAADRLIRMETCFPLKGVVGDTIAAIEELVDEIGKERLLKEYVVFLPTTSGPCRFGKYVEVLRLFLEQYGLGNLPIISPSSAKGYLDMETLSIDLPPRKLLDLVSDLYNAIFAADIYDDLLLRYRPYAHDAEEFNAAAGKSQSELENLLETKGASFSVLSRWVTKNIKTFKKLSNQGEKRFPLVLYIGEIYMRQHDPYTDHVIRKLESQGLELIRGPVHEWLRYVTYLAWRNTHSISYKAADFYMDWTDRKFMKVLKKELGYRHVIPLPRRIIQKAEKDGVYHGDVMGESALAIGLFNEYLKGRLNGGSGICGIFHVGPFTCMQEGVSTAKMRALLKEHRKKDPSLLVPIIHAFFGDSPNPNLDAEIAAFREQCYLKAENSGL